MNESIENKILRKIRKAQRGSLFFPDDFVTFGAAKAINKALERMVQKEELMRVARGIYTRPKIDPELGVLRPTLDEIAQAIARRDRARIIPTGAWVLNALGLSTQVPVNVVYLTNGSPRKIAVGKRAILFKKTSQRSIAAIGKISSLAIQALKEIGREEISDDQQQAIVNLLKQENADHLLYDMRLAPEWIRKIFRQALGNQNQNNEAKLDRTK
jgi:hypothetical protein